MRTFTIAHISDLHITAPRLRGRRLLSPKRLLAGFAWRFGKCAHHQARILDLALQDLGGLRPDAVVVTGDLTQIGLPEEYAEARGWLERISRNHVVAVVPGNHDVTRAESPAETLDLWEPWLAEPLPAGNGSGPLSRRESAFPTLRVLDDLALIGLNSARPSPLLMATGTLGPSQILRLRSCLREAGQTGRFRVVFLHHPPCAGVVSWRKRLTDDRPLAEVLAEEGVELLLHGHAHRPMLSWLQAGASTVPVIGAPSITEVTRGGPRYLVHRVSRSGDGWRLATAFRMLANTGDHFEEDPSPGLLLDTGPYALSRVAARAEGWNR